MVDLESELNTLVQDGDALINQIRSMTGAEDPGVVKRRRLLDGVSNELGEMRRDAGG